MKRYLLSLKMKALLAFSVIGVTVIVPYSSYGNKRPVKTPYPGEYPLVSVPVAGNTWASGKEGGGQVTGKGIENWTGKDVSFTTYFRVAQTGKLKLWLHLAVPRGKTKIRVSLGHPVPGDQAARYRSGNTRPVGAPKEITLSNGESGNIFTGEWQISDTGYIAVHIEAISKTAAVFADIDSLGLSGSAISSRTTFVKNNEGNFYYWGRRGPSVHLNYPVPANTNVEWFYTEITVPDGNDVLGSYFEADGFGQGYFGMQVNSPTERHILFSVWSPFDTQDPKDIPDSQKIRLLKKGNGVHAGEFGNEGSGGQSFLNYLWKAGVTYKFLLHCRPEGSDHTVFTAYFYAPETGKWMLIASFSRPQTHTWLKGLYSFLENFSPEQGNVERMACYGNQWIRTDQGRWMELDKARFTTDNTGNKGYRMDYGGGVKGNRFYLKNCGFFSEYTPAGIMLGRTRSGMQPDIELNKLP